MELWVFAACHSLSAAQSCHMVLESMDSHGEAGLLPQSESILEAYCRPNPRRKAHAKPPDSPNVQDHEQVLDLLQDLTPIYSPPDLPSISCSAPITLESNEELEAFVGETIERQPSSSPVPCSPQAAIAQHSAIMHLAYSSPVPCSPQAAVVQHSAVMHLAYSFFAAVCQAPTLLLSLRSHLLGSAKPWPRGTRSNHGALGLSLRPYARKQHLNPEDVLNEYNISRAALEAEGQTPEPTTSATVIGSQESDTDLSSPPSDSDDPLVDFRASRKRPGLRGPPFPEIASLGEICDILGRS